MFWILPVNRAESALDRTANSAAMCSGVPLAAEGHGRGQPGLAIGVRCAP